MKKSLEWIPSGAATILLVLAPDDAANAWGTWAPVPVPFQYVGVTGLTGGDTTVPHAFRSALKPPTPGTTASAIDGKKWNLNLRIAKHVTQHSQKLN